MLGQDALNSPSRTTSAVQSFSGVMTSSPLIDIFMMSFASRAWQIHHPDRAVLVSGQNPIG
jgi:hypothetical protein